MKFLIKFLGNAYNRIWCQREFENQTYTAFNERAVEYRFVFDHLASLCPRTVLDVGTGTTALPHMMRTCGFLVTAMDNMTDYWPKATANRHYHVIDDDIRRPRMTGTFDLITCVSVLEHIADHHRAVQSMAGLLNPGGHLIMTFPYNESAYAPNVYELDGSTAPPDLPFVTQAFSRNEVDAWRAHNPIELVDQEYWQFFTGDYWTVGDRLGKPMRTDAGSLHQITCLLMRKELDAGGG